jgi:hypothetical protein
MLGDFNGALMTDGYAAKNAKANNVEPRVYLKEIFTRLPAATCVKDVEALLPWKVTNTVV